MQEKATPPVARKDQYAVMKRVFLYPAITLLLALSIFPLLWSLGISFTDFQRGDQAIQATEGEEASGGLGFNLTLQNYTRMLTDERLHATIRNTFFYVFAGVIIQYFFGFGLALLLNQHFIGRNLVRVIFLMPMMVTPVAAAYTGRMMFDSTISPLAQLQRTLTSMVQSIGAALPGDFLDNAVVSIPWLTDSFVAPLTMVLIDSWQWIPFMTLLLLAGMQTIPDEIYEAARVDGASSWRILTRITFPILLPISATVILIRGLEIFKIIDVIMVTTGGGPGNATESLTMYIFRTALTFGNYGYASAISFALLVAVIIFATLFLAGMRRVTPR
ncbi:MAG: sugar ABC transporter permease [Anaerolineae bacterium]|nr:sugar ABC transporter permease [Anaerolineae bacterium]MCA9887654.1 sugar ABC transporter permease [Anaerolineae bacterium]MCA9894374.1 sugar ABC transporter permease [Anaerolineae bacterium]